MRPELKRLIVCADDFGLDVAVNKAVEDSSRNGILTCTSLMVGAPAAEDAIARAKNLPNLKVGLHIVLTAGHSVLPPSEIPNLVDASRAFDNNMARSGFRYFALPHVRRQLRAEIRAQFEAFRATGLSLDHVNAHRHFHIHPTLAHMIIEIGRDYGMKAMRVPDEPLAPLRYAAQAEGKKVTMPLYLPWIKMLGVYVRGKGLAVNDSILGLAWSGGMTESRVSKLLEALPDGVTELYFHPAVSRTPSLMDAMPAYKHVEEYEVLISPSIRSYLNQHNIQLISYSDLSHAA